MSSGCCVPDTSRTSSTSWRRLAQYCTGLKQQTQLVRCWFDLAEEPQPGPRSRAAPLNQTELRAHVALLTVGGALFGLPYSQRRKVLSMVATVPI